jgi:putative ABC transport system permease protein
MAEPVVVGQDVWKTYGSGDAAVNALQGISVEIREEEMVAVMGILALRAVVERRREIGMLRASGFSQRDVLRAFLLEYSYVTLLGLGIGTWLGIWIVYQLSLNPNAAASGVSFFAVPYLNIALIVVAAYGLAMLAIANPSIRASHLPPAEAVRATE